MCAVECRSSPINFTVKCEMVFIWHYIAFIVYLIVNLMRSVIILIKLLCMYVICMYIAVSLLGYFNSNLCHPVYAYVTEPDRERRQWIPTGHSSMTKRHWTCVLVITQTSETKQPWILHFSFNNSLDTTANRGPTSVTPLKAVFH